MIFLVPIKKRVKILVRPDTDEEGKVFFNKLSPILSQYNIHDAFLVDDFLSKYTNASEIVLKHAEISPLLLNFINTVKVPILIDIYKRRNKTTITVGGFSLLYIFRKLDDLRLVNFYD